MREEERHGAMRRRSIDPLGGDPNRSDSAIPNAIDLDVFVSIVFCLI